MPWDRPSGCVKVPLGGKGHRSGVGTGRHRFALFVSFFSHGRLLYCVAQGLVEIKTPSESMGAGGATKSSATPRNIVTSSVRVATFRPILTQILELHQVRKDRSRMTCPPAYLQLDTTRHSMTAIALSFFFSKSRLG